MTSETERRFDCTAGEDDAVLAGRTTSDAANRPSLHGLFLRSFLPACCFSFENSPAPPLPYACVPPGSGKSLTETEIHSAIESLSLVILPFCESTSSRIADGLPSASSCEGERREGACCSRVGWCKDGIDAAKRSLGAADDEVRGSGFPTGGCPVVASCGRCFGSVPSAGDGMVSVVTWEEGLYRGSNASLSKDPRSWSIGDSFDDPRDTSELRREW